MNATPFKAEYTAVVLFKLAQAIAVTIMFSVTVVRGDDQSTLLVAPAQPPGVIETAPAEVLPPAQSAGLTLEQLEQMALSNNPSLSRAAALVGAARGTWTQVGLSPNPSVGYEGQQLGSGGLAEQHGVVFNQEIVRGGKLRLNRAVAAGDVAIAEQQLAAQRQRVLTDVRIAFYQVLLAEQQTAIASQVANISEAGSRAADALLQAKEVGQGDVLQAQLEMENSRIQVENARNRRQAAWQSLTSIVGCPQLESQPLVGDAMMPPKEFDYQETLTKLLAESPEVGEAAQRVRRATTALERAQAERVGNVNVQGLVNWIDNGIGGKPDGGVAVTVPVPIFDRNQGGIRRAEEELTAARRELDQTELDIRNRLAPTFEQYANARNQVLRYHSQILPTAQQSLDLTQKGYRAGEINYISLLVAQRTYSQTNWNYLDALRTLRTSEAQLEGCLLQGSLQMSQTNR